MVALRNQGWSQRNVTFGSSFFSFFFLWLYLQHMEVPRARGQIETAAKAYATATATPDPSRTYALGCTLWQRRILNPLSKARDQTCILTETVLAS